MFADEVALEKTAAGDEIILGDPSEQGDAALNGHEAGVDAAGEDLGRQVDEFGVFAPGAQGDHDMPAGPQERDGGGEDFGEAGQKAMVADVGEVAAIEKVAVAVVVFVHPALGGGTDPAVGGGPVGR